MGSGTLFIYRAIVYYLLFPYSYPRVAVSSDSQTFPQALQQRVLVFDGAMGTEIYSRHVFVNQCFDELSVSRPDLIREIHTAYRDAGADVFTTNTFGANRVQLGKFGLADQTQRINRESAKLAREVADSASEQIFVAGSIGPLPQQSDFAARIPEMIHEQVEALLEGGADFILFETHPTRETLVQCVQAMKSLPGVPFVLSLVIVDHCESVAGESMERMFAPFPADCPEPIAWGMNCGTGPEGMLAAVRRAMELTDAPLIVQPNAGKPKEVDHRRIYLCSPEYLTTYAREYVDLGAAAVGGCCGTTPKHIGEMAAAIKPLARAQKEKEKIVIKSPAPQENVVEPVPFAERSQLSAKLAAGEWITTVELLPPRGYDLSSTIERSSTLRERGIHAINLPDGPRASARISTLITAERILHRAKIEPILHFCCRDRNLIGMQADLLACAACEIHNILFVTGDPPKLGDYPNATGIFDTDAIGMVAVQERLNRGIDLGGQNITPPTAAVIGVGLDPTALDQERELDRFRQKVEAGAEFAITQPVFDSDALLRFLDQVDHYNIPIIAGIWPLASLRNAMFMQNEVPGVEVPQAVMDRMAAAKSREEQLAVGIETARQSVERIRDRIAGIQVSAPFGKIEVALAVVES